VSAIRPERSRPFSRNIPPRWTIFSLALLGLFVVSLWVRLAAPRRPEPAPVAARPSSLAVLPFVNTNPDSADDYLGYGVAAELTRSLSQVPGLSVADRGAAFSRSTGDPLRLGRQLGVGTVLEGTIRRAGERLRLTVHLVDVGEGFDLWSETYDRTAADLLQIQNEIRDAIASTLRVGLPDAADRFSPSTSSPEAYDAYLAGIYLLEEAGGNDPQRAVTYLERAVRSDSGFALAHAALAEAHLPGGSYQSQPPRLAMLAAQAAALRALELDSTLAAPHRTLGTIRFGYNRDWPAAEAQFTRVIALEPRSSQGHQAYSRFLLAMGRADQSLQASERAVELSGGGAPSVGHLGWYYLHARQYGPARETLERAIEMDSTGWRAHFDLALLEQALGNYQQAMAQLERAGKLAPSRIEVMALGGQLQALAGDTVRARSTLRWLQDPSSLRYVSPYLIACVQAALGQRTAAFASLERAVKDRSEMVPYLRIDPRVDSLRSDRRFPRLLRRLRLP
jgi:TolB-like protein/Tfp pilus assembly protein PilF